MIETAELIDRLKHIRPMADVNDELYLIKSEGELTLEINNPFLKIISTIIDESTEDFETCISFKDFYEVLRNSLSDLVSLENDDLLKIDLRNSTANFNKKRKLFQEAFKGVHPSSEPLFMIEAQSLKHILSDLIKMETGDKYIIFNVGKDSITFSLADGGYDYNYQINTKSTGTFVFEYTSVQFLYKCIKNLESYIEVYKLNDEILLITDEYTFVLEDKKKTVLKDIPETKYRADMVTDDLVEAMRVISRISKKVYLWFNEDSLIMKGNNKDTSYQKEILIDSTVPSETLLALDSKEMFEMINLVKDDYLVLELPEDLSKLIVHNDEKTLILRSEVL